MICLFAIIGCVTAPKAESKTDSNKQPSKIVLSALAKLGYLEGNPNGNTFFIPRKPNAGDLYVIYWKEKNVLLLFPGDAAPEVAESPRLACGPEYKVEQKEFRREGDTDLASSTYLTTYGWAFQKLIEATVEGRRYELKYKKHRRPTAAQKKCAL